MRHARAFAIGMFFAALAAGTLTDLPRRRGPASTRILAGDFHVHAAPGDGMLPVWEVQREAERRGLDVIAVTNHNHRLALRLAEFTGLGAYPIVIPGQELTTPGFHMAAIGVAKVIDWRLTAREAIEAIHRQGGVAIASHPIAASWRARDTDVLRLLDGAEIAHPVVLARPEWDLEVQRFFDSTRAVNEDVAAIGSSDFHAGPLGAWRTYLLVDTVSREGVLDAIRRGRTVAAGPGGRLVGADADVAEVRRYTRAVRLGFGYDLSTWIALCALLALAAAVNGAVPYREPVNAQNR